MHPIRKLVNRRGMTLVEVLTVVSLMSILLAVAMPNLLAESKQIRQSAPDGYARSVAVAVQSRLYGMKNAGTTDSEYFYLNNSAADPIELKTDDSILSVRLVSNFGEKGDARVYSIRNRKKF